MNIKEVQEIKRKYSIIGTSEELNRAIDIALKVAQTDFSVLIQGESGVGKEVFSKIIHQQSQRKSQPFLAINCGAIPEGTIDSELFGHVKGAFTNAISEHKGIFEAANGGTIFLDEIGELPLNTQIKLLRVLESGQFKKVGSDKIQKTDVRIVAATNADLKKGIDNGKFRTDLYYRLNTISIAIPSLRERKEDIPLLVRYFTDMTAKNYSMPEVKFTPEAMRKIQDCYWRGNVRQLMHTIQRISILEQGRLIDEKTVTMHLPEGENETGLMVYQPGKEENSNPELPNQVKMLLQVIKDMRHEMDNMKGILKDLTSRDSVIYQGNGDTLRDDELILEQTDEDKKKPKVQSSHIEDIEEYKVESGSLRDNEKEMIINSLKKHKGNRRKAAEELGLSQRTIYRRIQEFDIEL